MVRTSTLQFSPQYMAFVLVLGDHREDGEESASRSCQFLDYFLCLVMKNMPVGTCDWLLIQKKKKQQRKSGEGCGGTAYFIKGEIPFSTTKSVGGGLIY